MLICKMCRQCGFVDVYMVQVVTLSLVSWPVTSSSSDTVSAVQPHGQWYVAMAMLSVLVDYCGESRRFKHSF